MKNDIRSLYARLVRAVPAKCLGLPDQAPRELKCIDMTENDDVAAVVADCR